MKAVRQAIVDGRMGRIISCSASVKWWRAHEYYEKDPWKGTWKLDGGAFANQGIHSLDLMVWMAGPVEEVEYAHLETIMHRIEAEDFGIAVVRFASGARGTIEITTCCRPDLATRLEIYGTRGSAAFGDARVTRVRDRRAGPPPDPGRSRLAVRRRRRANGDRPERPRGPIRRFLFGASRGRRHSSPVARPAIRSTY